jgi:hypothetical protein
MGWLDNWIAELTPTQPMPTSLPLVAKPVKPRQPKPEIESVWVQTRAPRNGDTGECEIGFYSVADGVLRMCDEKGKPTDTEYRLRTGDDARVIAGRLTLDRWRKTRDGTGPADFNRSLDYPLSRVC